MDFETIAIEKGWNDATKVAILLEYIDNQGDDATFIDFLLEQQ